MGRGESAGSDRRGESSSGTSCRVISPACSNASFLPSPPLPAASLPASSFPSSPISSRPISSPPTGSLSRGGSHSGSPSLPTHSTNSFAFTGQVRRERTQQARESRAV